MAIVPESGKIVWEFLMGPQVVNPIIDDIDGDGLKEIVLGSYAPRNFAEYNGTQDDSCYGAVFFNTDTHLVSPNMCIFYNRSNSHANGLSPTLRPKITGQGQWSQAFCIL